VDAEFGGRARTLVGVPRAKNDLIPAVGELAA
jgi:hypothetical protein